MINRIKEIYGDYKKEFIVYLKKLIKYFKKELKRSKYYYQKIKDSILKSENRKKYLGVTSILIILNLLIINLFISFGYYHNESSLSLIKAVVGDMYLEEYDYVLLVYLEEIDSSGNGSGKYNLTDNIPTLGYNYSGYKCQNNSTLIYDDETKTTSVTIEEKEVCSVYFDVIGNLDLTIKIMLEDGVNTNNYTLSNQIPSYGYKYSHYECANNGTLEYDSELHTVKISSDSKEYCSVYFNKESSDISINLFVEENYQTDDYIERVSIPANNIYILNSEKSFCKNNNNERIDSTITYTDGYIDVVVSEIAICDVYLDKYEE